MTVFKLDLDDERLFRDGKPLAIGYRALQMLQLLASNPNRLLTKDQILDAIWGDVYVTEGMVKEYVHDLRLALGDDPKSPKFIETIRGRGYRFLGGVEIVGRAVEPAVRPFVVISELASNPRFDTHSEITQTVTHALRSALARFRTLAVIAAPDCELRNEERGFQVSGHLDERLGEMRLSIALAETPQHRQIWSDTFAIPNDAGFEAIDVVTREVVCAVEVEISRAERDRLKRVPDHNKTAWDWFEDGIWNAYKDREEYQLQALRSLRASLALDPDFAPASAMAAYVICSGIIDAYLTVDDALIEEATDYAQKAIALDDRDAFAHKAMARLCVLRGQYEFGVSEGEKAVTLNPNDAECHHALGFVQMLCGRVIDAERSFANAVEIGQHHPKAATLKENWAWALIDLERNEEAVQIAEAATFSPSPDYWAFATYAAALAVSNRDSESREMRRRTIRKNPNFCLGTVRRLFELGVGVEPHRRYIQGLKLAGFED